MFDRPKSMTQTPFRGVPPELTRMNTLRFCARLGTPRKNSFTMHDLNLTVINASLTTLKFKIDRNVLIILD
jgi:hypothetical protein